MRFFRLRHPVHQGTTVLNRLTPFSDFLRRHVNPGQLVDRKQQRLFAGVDAIGLLGRTADPRQLGRIADLSPGLR